MARSIIQQRSFEFALDVIRLYRELQEKREYVLSKQLLRCGTSIGANVEEASAGQSRADFRARMAIASKESREAHYWLRLLQASQLVEIDVTNQLARADELIKILTSIVKTTSEKSSPDA